MIADRHHYQMDTIIEDALEEVELKGTAASDRSLLLAGFWWLSRQRTDAANVQRRKRNILIPAVERGGPWAVLGAVLVYIMEKGLL